MDQSREISREDIQIKGHLARGPSSHVLDTSGVFKDPLNSYTGTYNPLFLLDDKINLEVLQNASITVLSDAFEGFFQGKRTYVDLAIAVLRKDHIGARRSDIYTIPLFSAADEMEAFAIMTADYLSTGIKRFLARTPFSRMPSFYEVDPLNDRHIISSSVSITDFDKISQILTEEKRRTIEQILG